MKKDAIESGSKSLQQDAGALEGTSEKVGIKSSFLRAAAKSYSEHKRKIAWLGSAATVWVAAEYPEAWPALVASAAILMERTSSHAISDIKAFGSKTGISALTLGIITGVVHMSQEALVVLQSSLNGTTDMALSHMMAGSPGHVWGLLGAAVLSSGGIKAVEDLKWDLDTKFMAYGTGFLGLYSALGEFNQAAGALMAGYGLQFIYERVKNGGDKCAHDHGDGNSCGGANHNHKSHEEVIDDVSAQIVEELEHSDLEKIKDGVSSLASIVSLIAVSKVFVDQLMGAGSELHISEEALGALASAGTLAPELAMIVNAGLKGDSDLAIGNVVGCNVSNIWIIGGLLAAFGVDVPENLRPTNPEGTFLWGSFMASGLGLYLVDKYQKGEITVKQGAAAIGLYVGFLAGAYKLGGQDTPAFHSDHHTDGQSYNEMWGELPVDLQNELVKAGVEMPEKAFVSGSHLMTEAEKNNMVSQLPPLVQESVMANDR